MFAQAPPTTADSGTPSTVEPAAPPKPDDVRGMVKNQDFIVWSLILAGLLLVAAVVFMFFDRWRKRPTGESAREASFSLSSFREMYDRGELTEAEFEKIKARWADKMRAGQGPQAPPAAATAPPAPPPPEGPPAS